MSEKIILKKANEWANNPYFNFEFRNEIQQLLEKNNIIELTDRFYKDLEFGTGGLRGIIGVGSNRINIYTVRKTTQGLANYIKQNYPNQKVSVAIAYDSRHQSEIFAKEAACVLAGNQIQAYLFDKLKPTPMLSFAVRELKSIAGIVITASHNPPEYNGYKVYWNDGAQITSPNDDGIIKCINELNSFEEIKWQDSDAAFSVGTIKIITATLEEKYYQSVLSLTSGNIKNNEKLRIIYTPLHGAGNLPVREILSKRGFIQTQVVKAQELPDGNFTTVTVPNPEETSALQLALQQATFDDHVILATDPDADRMGVMVNHNQKWHKLNGNQIGQLLLYYYLKQLNLKGKLPKNGVYITTIVSSDLGRKIADSYGLQTRETLTGFKYIGEQIRKMEEDGSGTFIFGMEESYGYLFGDFVRDKDAVMACMIFAEMAADLLAQNKTCIDLLEEIYQKFQYHQDSLVNQTMKGQQGFLQIKNIMERLRIKPPSEIANQKIIKIQDYLNHSTPSLKSNVLAIHLEDGSRITARPSGTEPKIKYYFNLCGINAENLEKQRLIYEKAFLDYIRNF